MWKISNTCYFSNSNSNSFCCPGSISSMSIIVFLGSSWTKFQENVLFGNLTEIRKRYWIPVIFMFKVLIQKFLVIVRKLLVSGCTTILWTSRTILERKNRSWFQIRETLSRKNFFLMLHWLQWLASPHEALSILASYWICWEV